MWILRNRASKSMHQCVPTALTSPSRPRSLTPHGITLPRSSTSPALPPPPPTPPHPPPPLGKLTQHKLSCVDAILLVKLLQVLLPSSQAPVKFARPLCSSLPHLVAELVSPPALNAIETSPRKAHKIVQDLPGLSFETQYPLLSYSWLHG